VKGKLIGPADVASLKNKILHSGLSVSELVETAWASAATFRHTDKRGGANGARIRLAPQKDWAINNPSDLNHVLEKLEAVQKNFNHGGKYVSLADLIVLGGAAGIEQAAKAAGHTVKVPFTPGRTDATEEQTDVMSFSVLEPKADAFRNYYGDGNALSPTEMLVDRANALSLTVPEMTVLVGGMRAIGANADQSKNGIFTHKPGTLTNDFFVNLLDMSTKWQKSAQTQGLYEGLDRKTGQVKWTATPVDLIFGSHSELRAVSEVYAEKANQDKFIRDFVTAWNKVMMLDRYDLM
jgi:catalase-peroxidase